MVAVELVAMRASPSGLGFRLDGAGLVQKVPSPKSLPDFRFVEPSAAVLFSRVSLVFRRVPSLLYRSFGFPRLIPVLDGQAVELSSSSVSSLSSSSLLSSFGLRNVASFGPDARGDKSLSVAPAKTD